MIEKIRARLRDLNDIQEDAEGIKHTSQQRLLISVLQSLELGAIWEDVYFDWSHRLLRQPLFNTTSQYDNVTKFLAWDAQRELLLDLFQEA